ncbi:hypothetical protein [Streptomyces sp. NPDC058371]|uniref:hypothetical protein n=1 Tax=Streptomyces sp. NPDC058371 TaxID=3346463 RepID=UPI003663BE5F
MSRETDSSSSGPNGRGGAAYPSGTPPYGTPAASEDGADAARAAAQPEERKTETTLTTRIRINIPGSRPIPPVVVRTPMGDVDPPADTNGAGSDPETTGSMRLPAVASVPSLPSGEGSDEPAGPGEKASDWFAPRKSGAPKGGPGGGSTNGAGLPGGSAAGAGGPAGPAASAGMSAGMSAGQGAPGGARPGGPGGSGGANGAGPLGGQGGMRPGGTNGAGLGGAAGAGPVAPGHGGGTGSFDVSGALPGGGGTGSFPSAAADGGDARRDDLPYFSDNGQGGGGGQRGPSGPTGGPVTGDGHLLPPGAGPRGPGVGPGGPGLTPGAPGMGPGRPGAGPGVPGGGLSDDTAILTPQRHAPEPGYPEPGAQGYGGPGDNVSGHTVTSGIPVVPGAPGSPFGPGAHTDGPLPHTPPKLPEPAPKPAASARPAKKKGRSKLVLLTVAVVVVGGGAYGAGLLMNHSDVPKGTTVLGVDIGGGTRDEAVKKLDDAFGDRTNKALTLSVDGETVALKPDQAGLLFDSKATASAAAKSDYNPMSVIGSLFGQQRVVEPVMPPDEEKLQAALERAAGGSGSASEGTIKFQSGKAVPVYGKTGKGIDVAASTQAVEDAYRTQVETNSSAPVKVPTTTKEPTVSKAEVDRMMKKFAEPAMSGIVTVKTDATHAVSFSPQNSLWKFLGVKAQNGKLVDVYDKAALTQLYGNTFDGVLIARGTGKKTAVTVEDVIGALRPALFSKNPADRVVVIDTNPS